MPDTDADAVAAIAAHVIGGTGGGLTAPSSSLESDNPEGTAIFDFSEEFQTRLAALSLRDTSFLRRTDGIIKPDYFGNIYEAILVNISLNYFERYRQSPRGKAEWIELLKEAKKDNRIRKEMLPGVIEKLKEVFTADISGSEYAAEKCGQFARHQAIINALPHIITLVTEKGKIDEAAQVAKKAFDVGAHEEAEEIDFFGDIENRTQYRKDVIAGKIAGVGIPTGIAKFDNLLHHKGLGRKELTAFMGGAKRGKSIWLGEIGARFSMNGANVLYITLELSKEIVALRLDANLSNTNISDVDASLFSVEKALLAKRTAKNGLFKIVEYPSGTFKPSALRRLIEKYKSDGLVFDAIFVDYADIMAPDHNYGTEVENSKSIWLALRAIAQEEDVAMVTATQTTRGGHEASTAKASDVASDFNKVRIADLLISINSTEEERADGIARLFFAASRNQAGDFCLKIEQDLSQGKAICGILGVS